MSDIICQYIELETRKILYEFWKKLIALSADNVVNLMKVVRSGDLVSYTAEEGVRILGEGKFLVSDSFPGNERTKYCLTSKVHFLTNRFNIALL